MLSKLNNELLRRGPSAVLPQNLTDAWLATLQEQAETYLDTTYDLEVCNPPSDDADPMLVACVTEIYLNNREADTQLEGKDLGEMITIYSLSLVIESAIRRHGLSAPRPELDTFFTWDRIRNLTQAIPELSDFLDQACILRDAKPGWIDAIKGKILSGWRGNAQADFND